MGNRQLILSMGADDLNDKVAFFNGLAHKLRGYGYNEGSEALDVDNLSWAFFKGVVNKSPKVFEIIMKSRSSYSYMYNLNGAQRSGSVEDLKDIRDILP